MSLYITLVILVKSIMVCSTPFLLNKKLLFSSNSILQQVKQAMYAIVFYFMAGAGSILLFAEECKNIPHKMYERQGGPDGALKWAPDMSQCL